MSTLSVAPLLPALSLSQVSACGWLLSVLRAPQGTGIYPVRPATHGHSHGRGAADATTPSGPPGANAHTVASSCGALAAHGLDHTLGDLLQVPPHCPIYAPIQAPYLGSYLGSYLGFYLGP